jgi:DNA-directed RNA polymerase subunit RPC12/RpoP
MTSSEWQPRVKRSLSVAQYGIRDVYATKPNVCPKCGKKALKEVRNDIVEKLPERYWDSAMDEYYYKWMKLKLYECVACGYTFLEEFYIDDYPYSEDTMRNELKAKDPYKMEKKEKTREEGCFISTAVYGSSSASRLDILRNFRDDVLLKNSLISWTVKIYQHISPSIAKRIEKDENAKKKLHKVIDICTNLIEKRNNTNNSLCKWLFSTSAFFVYVYGLIYAKFLSLRVKPV